MTDEEFVRMIINKQFEINDITDIDYDLVVANREAEDTAPPGERWYERYTTTKDKEEEFVDYLTEQMKKRYKIKGRVLEANVGMLLLNWGLKRSDFSWDELKKEDDE